MVIGIPVFYIAFFGKTATYEELLKKSDENYINNVAGIDTTIPQRERLIDIQASVTDEESKEMNLAVYDKLGEIFKDTTFKRVPSMFLSKSLLWFAIDYDYHVNGLRMRIFISISGNTVQFKYAVHHDKKFYLYQAKITDEQKQQLTDLLNDTVK